MASFLFKWIMFLPVFYFQVPAGSPIPGKPEVKGPAGFHPFYLSVTEIEQNAKDKTLEVSCKIFTDDFERTLRLQNKGTIDLLQPKDKSAMNTLVSEYVKKHLSITVDGKSVELQFIGYEQQEEGIESYYQVNNIAAVKKIDIIDNILFEYKKEQFSIIHVTVNGSRKSSKLNNPDDKVSFQF